MTTVVTKSEQFSASSLETQGGVAYPTAETISGLNSSSMYDFLRSIISNKEAVATPREWPTSLNLYPCWSVRLTTMVPKERRRKKGGGGGGWDWKKTTSVSRSKLNFQHLIFLQAVPNGSHLMKEKPMSFSSAKSEWSNLQMSLLHHLKKRYQW